MEADTSVVIPTPSREYLKPQFSYMEKIIKASNTVYMWPYAKKINPVRYHCVVWLITMMCVIYTVCCSLQIRAEYKNVDTIAFRVAPLMGTISAGFHYIYVYFRGDKYLLLVSQMDSHFIHYSLFPKKSRASIMKYYKSTNKLILAYGIFTVIWMLQMCAVPVFIYIWKISKSSSDVNNTRTEAIEFPLLLKVYAPFDYEKQPANVLFYAYQFITIMTIAWLYVLYDCFWFMVLIMTIAQFVLLKDSVKTIAEILGRDDSKDYYQPLKKNEIRMVEEGLKNCIRQHQFMREFVSLLVDVNNINILVDSLHGVISVGFVLLEMTAALNVGDRSRVHHSLEYLTTMIEHIFIFNWLGNELTTKEEELAEVLYEIPWHKCPSLKPVLSVMMIQARRPLRLTGGRLYKLGLDFFVSVLQASFSYFTFFLQFRNPALTN